MTRKTILIRRPPTIDIVCPSCGVELSGPQPAPGEIAACPQCNQEFVTSSPATLVTVQSSNVRELRNLVAAVMIGGAIVMVVGIVVALVRLLLAV
jgi:hypothetical protein